MDSTHAAIDLSDPDTYRDGVPHEVFDDLRRDAPVSWRPEPDGPGFWAVTRHADAVQVLKQSTLFSSWRGGVMLTDPPPEFLDRLRESMMNRDPPDHTRLRRLVNSAFSPRRIATIEHRIIERAKELVDGVIASGCCDFATDLAGELPLFVICELLGVPFEDRARLYGYTARMFDSPIADRALAMRDRMAAAAEMRSYGAELAEKKRRAPGDDLMSDLLRAEIDGRQLDAAELQAFFMLLFNAGADSTRSTLSLGMSALLDRPELVERLTVEPALLPTAVEEILRFEPPVIQIRRTATAETVLGGHTIHEGDKVVVFFVSANRDELVFTDPHRFDPARDPNPHIAFGFGAHYCLGAPLARLEIRHLLAEVLRRMRNLECAGVIVRERTNFVRTVKSLPIRFTAA